MREVAQVLVDAISVGGLYALTALGIGMIFGVMRLVNFAHADLITFAGYAILIFFAQSTMLAIVAAALARGLLKSFGLLQELPAPFLVLLAIGCATTFTLWLLWLA